MNILQIPCPGSLQNPAWSPDGKSLSFTRWRGGYNKGSADVGIFDLQTGKASLIVEGGVNVSQPGSCWNATLNAIVISSDKSGIDWPHIYYLESRTLHSIRYRKSFMGYEPSWSPDGRRIIFEQHHEDQEGNGRIVINSGTIFDDVTDDGDCRQPNWSPDGNFIVWQRNCGNDIWELQSSSPAISAIKHVAYGTDATFGPNNEILYSDNDGALRTPSRILFKQAGIYAGAASWSPDGKTIAFETCRGDPDGSAGTKIATIAVVGATGIMNIDSDVAD
jgi:TolB protein